MSLVALLLVCLLAAGLCWLPRATRFAPAITLAACLVSLVLSAHIALQVTRGGALVAISGVVAADGFSAFIILLVSLVAAIAALYSWGYMAKAAPRADRLRVYYANYNLFIFSMLAIPAVVDPTLVWIFVELTTLSSAMLVSFEDTHAALEAAWKYVALSLMGAAIALLGFLVLFAAVQAADGSSYTWSGLLAAAPKMPPVLLQTAFLLILVGLGTKVGLVPLHTWLPDAHSQAPSPVCALLSGIETTAVLYVILRLTPVLRAAGTNVDAWVVAFGLISVGVAAFLLLQVRDYKRMFAYSTVEHMGIILASVGLGASVGHYATAYQMLTHTLTKAFCFFAAGTALLALETRQIGEVRGLIRTSPAAAVGLLLGGLAIAGAPPFAVFLSEFSIFRAGFASGQYWATGLLVAFIVIGFCGIMAHVNRMVFGEPPAGARTHVRSPRTCVAVLFIAGGLVVLLGLYMPPPLNRLLQLAAAAMDK